MSTESLKPTQNTETEQSIQNKIKASATVMAVSLAVIATSSTVGIESSDAKLDSWMLSAALASWFTLVGAFGIFSEAKVKQADLNYSPESHKSIAGEIILKAR